MLIMHLLIVRVEVLVLGADAPGVGLLVMLNSDLGEMADDVLDLGVLDGAGLASQVVEPSPVAEQVVDDGDDNGDSDGVTPDNNNSDDVGVSVESEDTLLALDVDGVLNNVTGQPAEDTEEGGKNIDTEDGADQLPSWKSLKTTGDEDEPVLGEGDLQEEDALDVTVELDESTVWQEHGTTEDPGTESEESTENDGDDPDLWQLPLDWTLLEVSVIVGDGDSGQISEESDEDDELGAHGLVDDDHGRDEVKLQVQAKSNTVLDVGLHTLENLARDLNGRDNGGKTWSKEDDIGGSLGSLGGTLDSDTAVGLLERWSIVDTVTSHGGQVTTLLEHLDDLVLVLWEDLSESISLLAKIVHGGSGKTTVDKSVGIVNLGAESQHAASLLGDSKSITSQHLNLETKVLGVGNSLGGILTWWVEEREHTEQLPVTLALLNGNTEGTETTVGELESLGAVLVGDGLGAVGHGKDSLWSSLGAGVDDAVLLADGGNTLGDWVEWSERVGSPSAHEHLLGSWVTLEGQDGDLVDWIQVLCVVGRGKGSDGHHPVDVDTVSDVWLTNGKLVGGEGTGLIRAENVDTSEGLDGSELLDNSFLLGEVGSSDSQSGGGDDWKTDWDTHNEENKGVVKQVAGRVLWSSDLEVTEEATDPGGKDESHDEDQQCGTDVVHDSLEVTGVGSTLNKGSGLSDEGSLGGGGDNGVSLTALASGGVVTDIGDVLLDGEGLSGHRRLINSDESVSSMWKTLLLVIRVGSDLAASKTLCAHLSLVVGEALLLVVVSADETAVTWNNRSVSTTLKNNLVRMLVNTQLGEVRTVCNLQYLLEQSRGQESPAQVRHGRR